MPIIDNLQLMLVNMSAGLLLLALYLLRGFGREDQRPWVPAFAIVGAVALLFGLRTSWFWPLPGGYNSPFGDMSVLLGAIYLGIAWAVAMKCSLSIVGIYSAFAGAAAIICGAGMYHFQMTQSPALTFVGFGLSGLGAMLLGPAVGAKGGRAVRKLAAVVLIGAAAIWALVGYSAYWTHLKFYSGWQPDTMLARPEPPK